MNYWLMKTEPNVYSIDDLKSEGTTHWEGVRKYQARNFMMKDMKVGDRVLFYHSNTKPPGVVGLATVTKLAYPDFFAWDPESKYFDPKSPKDKPRWFMVDVSYESQFKGTIGLDTLKANPNLEDMLVVQKGSRLSVQPVTKNQFNEVVQMGESLNVK